MFRSCENFENSVSTFFCLKLYPRNALVGENHFPCHAPKSMSSELPPKSGKVMTTVYDQKCDISLHLCCKYFVLQRPSTLTCIVCPYTHTTLKGFLPPIHRQRTSVFPALPAIQPPANLQGEISHIAPIREKTSPNPWPSLSRNPISTFPATSRESHFSVRTTNLPGRFLRVLFPRLNIKHGALCKERGTCKWNKDV